MKNHSLQSLLFLFVCILLLSGFSQDENPTTEGLVSNPQKTLNGSAKGFFVGIAMKSDRLEMRPYTEVIEREFGSMTSEYEMKMKALLPTKGNYNWSKADKIVDYCISKGIKIHGHALIWHQSTPDWIVNYKGTDAQFEQEIKEYITAVVTRYKGKVTSWDVVNEAVADKGGVLRNTVFKERMGDDYIAKCFQFAHEADPNCKLFYNDYSLEKNESKQQKVFELIADWQRRKIPIQGIGFQMHVGYLISKNQIQTVTNRAVGTGLLIHYSELDMRMNPSNDITKFTQERALAQQEKYKEIVQIYNAIPVANKFGITLWGLKDDDSWLLKHHKNNNEWPLLFDSNFKPKRAYTGFLEGLQ